jgi:hypothetical protein
MATHSTLTANPTNVVADGTSTSTITMQAKDANGNNLTTGGLIVNVECVAIATTTGSSSTPVVGVIKLTSTMSVIGPATLSSVSDNADGTYTATITNSTVETVTVSAGFNNSKVVTVRPPVVRLLPLASLACIVIVEVVVSCVLTPYELASKVEFAAIATTTGGELVLM